MVDVGTLYFNAATVPEGEVFDYNEKKLQYIAIRPFHLVSLWAR